MSFSVSCRSTACRAVLWGTVLLLLGTLGACDAARKHARTVYDVGGLTVERAGWDTLRVTPAFVRHTSLGGRHMARPETTFVHVFGADYDTLYAGPATGAIPLPDRRLGSREPLLVEACGTFRHNSFRGNADEHTGAYPERTSAMRAIRSPTARALCNQKTIFASPKRVRAEASDVTFPLGGDFQRGRYDVRLVAERRAYGTDDAVHDTTWEVLEDAEVPGGYLLARSESAGGAGTVRVPMAASGHGSFDLSRHDGYADFQYHLRVGMEGAGAPVEDEKPPAAAVAFEVLAGINGAPPQPVSRAQKEVRRLTPAERRRQVQLFAHSAAEEIAQRLLEGEWDDARATVHGWSYDRLRGRYEVELRVRWYAPGGFRDDRYTLEGTLTVNDGSRRARFAGERGNRRAVRRWRRAVDGDALPLGVLDATPADEDALPEDLPEVEEERARELADRRVPPRSVRRHSSRRRSHRHDHR